MIYLRSKQYTECRGWISFQPERYVTPLDFHLYDFKIGDEEFAEYSEAFQHKFDVAITWKRLNNVKIKD